MLDIQDLNKLKAPFPKEKLGVKVQSLSKARDKALLVLFVSHTDVMDRIEEVDPSWSAEALEVKGYPTEELVHVRMKMTIKGVTRENVGEGNEVKGAYSDAIKRCAMLYGISRYLYDSELVWVPYNETKDKYRAWTIQDYEGHTRTSLPQAPAKLTSVTHSEPSYVIPKPVLTPPQPIPPPPVPHTFQEGVNASQKLGASAKPTCAKCGTPMLVGKAGIAYYCPNFKDISKGEHPRVKVAEWIASQTPLVSAQKPGLSHAFSEDVPFDFEKAPG